MRRILIAAAGLQGSAAAFGMVPDSWQPVVLAFVAAAALRMARAFDRWAREQRPD